MANEREVAVKSCHLFSDTQRLVRLHRGGPPKVSLRSENLRCFKMLVEMAKDEVTSVFSYRLKCEETVVFGFIGVPKAGDYFWSTNSKFYHSIVLQMLTFMLTASLARKMPLPFYGSSRCLSQKYSEISGFLKCLIFFVS
jgi:hypothetical protein